MVEIFGWSIKRKDDPVEEQKVQKSFVPPTFDDGAVNVATGATFGTFIDMDGTVRSEAELVSRYRQMSLQPEIRKAIDEIVNEAIVFEENNEAVEIAFQDEKAIPKNIQKAIIEEFKTILNILEFKKLGYDLFKRWYIDGRIYFHIIIDETKPNEGIKELRYIDPRKIRKIRELIKRKDPKTSATLTLVKDEYFLYNERGLQLHGQSVGPGGNYGTSGLKIKKDSIIHITSGLMDSNNTTVLSYLHGAIKPLNQLRGLEDATLIYHLARAPERRIFRVEVGNLPTMRAEQHVQNMMTNHKNKVSYNASTGDITDQRKFMHMLEDYWIPTREGRGTEIDILQGGTQLSQLLESVEYFQNSLYEALSVPTSRMRPEATFNLGRASEINRDEISFAKFIDRIRMKFNDLFIETLGKQLILKGISTPEDWDEIKKEISFQYARDNYYAELKDLEIMNERFIRLRDIDEFVGKYYSAQWVRKNILKQSDDDIEELDKEITDEAGNPQFNQELLHPDNIPPEEQNNEQN